MKAEVNWPRHMKEAEGKEGIKWANWIIADQAGEEAGEYQEEDIDIDEGDRPQEVLDYS
ncbi:hypothetical protein GG344DRAFT_84598 [Lentinula edodes]|nr:hypothetical protein GG344DRAFT_84598 [Lentinula edodes]